MREKKLCCWRSCLHDYAGIKINFSWFFMLLAASVGAESIKAMPRN
jgi:hypothetical protein